MIDSDFPCVQFQCVQCGLLFPDDMTMGAMGDHWEHLHGPGIPDFNLVRVEFLGAPPQQLGGRRS